MTSASAMSTRGWIRGGAWLLVAGGAAAGAGMASCAAGGKAAEGGAATPAPVIRPEPIQLSLNDDDIEPGARRALREMCNTLSAADEFSFHADVLSDDVILDRVKLQFGASLDVFVRRPDGLRADFDGDRVARRLWYDGATTTLLAIDDNIHGSLAAPPTTGAMINLLIQEHGLSFPLAVFMYPDPYAILTNRVELGMYVGLHDVGGVPCHHLLFMQPTMDWQIWIDAVGDPVPRKILFTYKVEPEAPQYIATLSGWNLAADLSDELFDPVIPEGASEVDFATVAEAVLQNLR